jgi:hypothetical protein
MGLPTLDFAILPLETEDVPFTGGAEEPGPAFAARHEEGVTWDGTIETLLGVANDADVAKLVALDTYIRNADRHAPTGRRKLDNVFLSSERESTLKYRLLAIDHTHAFTNGRPIGPALARIDAIKDQNVFGLFDEFKYFLSAAAIFAASDSIDRITDGEIESVVTEVPRPWLPEESGRAAIRTFLCERRNYLRNTLVEALLAEARDWPSTGTETME